MDTENSDLDKTIAEEPDQSFEDVTPEELLAFKLNDKPAKIRKGDPAIDGELLTILESFTAERDASAKNVMLEGIETFFAEPSIRRNLGLKECVSAAEVLTDFLIENGGSTATVGRTFKGLLIQLQTTARQSEAGKMGGKIRRALAKAKEAVASHDAQNEETEVA